VKLVYTLDTLRQELKSVRENSNIVVGFVPTMGYLHPGHASLIKKARENSDFIVVSIFVNPTQFGPNEDFDSYPRDLKQDLAICKNMGTDLVFIPEVDEIYPVEQLTSVSLTKLTDSLCGQYRPGHFNGVTTVVSKLFNAVQPDTAYFGQKDAQQLLVIQRMVTELLYPIKITACPTIREPGGLAMSSRNIRLSEKEKKAAPLIYQGLLAAEKMLKNGENRVDRIINAAECVMHQSQLLNIQYLECRNRFDLSTLNVIDQPAVLATAVYINRVRLIDNIFLEPQEN